MDYYAGVTKKKTMELGELFGVIMLVQDSL